jgi:hypothetical protein
MEEASNEPNDSGGREGEERRKWMNYYGLSGESERELRRRAVLVLAIFTRNEPLSEFLTLPSASLKVHAEAFEGGS